MAIFSSLFGDLFGEQPAQLAPPIQQTSPFDNMNFFQKLGALGQHIETKGQSTQQAVEDFKRKQQAAELGRVVSGQNLPAYLQNESTPEQLNQYRLNQLAGIGSPEAINAMQQYITTPEEQQGMDLNKLRMQQIQQDIAQGKALTPLQIQLAKAQADKARQEVDIANQQAKMRQQILGGLASPDFNQEGGMSIPGQSSSPLTNTSKLADAYRLAAISGDKELASGLKGILDMQQDTSKLGMDVDKASFDKANTLRDEYLAGSKDYIAQRDAYGRIVETSQNPTAAGDLALIFNYMKLLDPGSTVREGEFATAQNSAGIPQRIQAQYNKVVRGERLAAEQRGDFVNKAKEIYNSANRQNQKLVKQYTDLANKSGAPAELVVPDLQVELPPTQPPLPSDIAFTAKKYGITEAEVKQRLGIQ